MDKIIVVCAALMDPDGRLLIGKRPEGKYLPGLWEFPGGKVKPREELIDGLSRELEEELGIKICKPCMSLIKTTSGTYISDEEKEYQLELHLYIGRKWEWVVRPMENQRLKWIRLKDIDKYLMIPTNLPLIKALKDQLS